MAKEIVTLNIEDTCLRLMVVRKKGVGLAVSQPLEAGLVKNGAILDRHKLSQAIKDLLWSHRVKSTRVIVAISGVNAFYRLISQPPVPAGMLAEAAKREAERVMPVSLSELYLSHQVLARSDTESLLCMVGLSRRPSEAQVETIKMAGLSPYMMDVKPLAIARAVNQPEGILIDVQDAAFDIALMVDGLPQIMRSLPFPKPGLPIAEKEAAIHEELERTVKFYDSIHKDRRLKATTPLFLSGEIDDQGEEQLSQRLGYGSKPLPQSPIAHDGLDIRRYLVNLGLALKVTNGADRLMGININVLPEIYLPARRPLVQVLALAFLPVGLAGLVWAYSTIDRTRDETQALQSRLAQAQEAVQMRPKQTAQLRELEQKAAALEPLAGAWDRVLGGLQQGRLKAGQGLSEAVALAGQFVTIGDINYKDNGGLIIQGTAPSKEQVLAYAQKLRDTRGFGQTLVRSVHDKPGKAAVEFILELK